MQGDAERWCRRNRTGEDRTRALWVWGGLDVEVGVEGAFAGCSSSSVAVSQAELSRAELSRSEQDRSPRVFVVPFSALCSGWERSRAIGMTGRRQRGAQSDTGVEYSCC